MHTRNTTILHSLPTILCIHVHCTCIYTRTCTCSRLMPPLPVRIPTKFLSSPEKNKHVVKQNINMYMYTCTMNMYTCIYMYMYRHTRVDIQMYMYMIHVWGDIVNGTHLQYVLYMYSVQVYMYMYCTCLYMPFLPWHLIFVGWWLFVAHTHVHVVHV